MNLRRVTILAHSLLILALLAGVAWLAMATALSFVPDPDDPGESWAGVILIPIVTAGLVGTAVVALTLRSWMRSGDRATLVMGDMFAALMVIAGSIFMPPAFFLAALVTLVVAGGSVAAAKPSGPAGLEPVAAVPIRRPSPVVVIAVVVLAVLVGFLLAGPLLLLFSTLVPID